MENNRFKWNESSKFEKIFCILFVVFIFGASVYSYFNRRSYEDELKKHGIIVSATITSILGSRSSFVVNIDYNFKGKKFSSIFYTNDLDTLQKLTAGKEVNVMISSIHPDDDEVKLISVAK